MAAAPVFLALPAGVKLPAGVTKPQVAVVQAALATAVAEAAAGKPVRQANALGVGCSRCLAWDKPGAFNTSHGVVCARASVLLSVGDTLVTGLTKPAFLAKMNEPRVAVGQAPRDPDDAGDGKDGDVPLAGAGGAGGAGAREGQEDPPAQGAGAGANQGGGPREEPPVGLRGAGVGRDGGGVVAGGGTAGAGDGLPRPAVATGFSEKLPLPALAARATTLKPLLTGAAAQPAGGPMVTAALGCFLDVSGQVEALRGAWTVELQAVWRTLDALGLTSEVVHRLAGRGAAAPRPADLTAASPDTLKVLAHLLDPLVLKLNTEAACASADARRDDGRELSGWCRKFPNIVNVGFEAPDPSQVEFSDVTGSVAEVRVPGPAVGKSSLFEFLLVQAGPGARSWGTRALETSGSCLWFVPLGKVGTTAATSGDGAVLAARLGVTAPYAARTAVRDWVKGLVKPYFTDALSGEEEEAWASGWLPPRVPVGARRSPFGLIQWLTGVANATMALYDTRADPLAADVALTIRGALLVEMDSESLAAVYDKAASTFNTQVRHLARAAHDMGTVGAPQAILQNAWGTAAAAVQLTSSWAGPHGHRGGSFGGAGSTSAGGSRVTGAFGGGSRVTGVFGAGRGGGPSARGGRGGQGRGGASFSRGGLSPFSGGGSVGGVAGEGPLPPGAGDGGSVVVGPGGPPARDEGAGAPVVKRARFEGASQPSAVSRADRPYWHGSVCVATANHLYDADRFPTVCDGQCKREHWSKAQVDAAARAQGF